METNEVPINDNEEAEMVLPPGAVQNQDGSITLVLAFPISGSGQATVKLHRLTGADMRRVARSRADKAMMLMACSTRTPFPRWTQLANKLADSDLANVRDIVADLAGFGSARNRRCSAPDASDAVTLPLLKPLRTSQGKVVSSIVVHRIRGEDLKVASSSRDFEAALFARSVKMPPCLADALYDDMDALDIAAVRALLPGCR